ncbi:DUF1289 domain-containing protein [Comamonas composti]|uniref:DUF1289 domain-containing protein n=1 Tax=Comamonas composti TaxID=408558 RepID=UPI0004279984|nr:DUF1289 domain-containing protein [Comamonas composti]
MSTTPLDLLQARAQLVLRAAGTAAGVDEQPLASPCISVCRMTADRSHCQGCFRTIEEIRAWSAADNEVRRATWQRLLSRAGLAMPEA